MLCSVGAQRCGHVEVVQSDGRPRSYKSFDRASNSGAGTENESIPRTSGTSPAEGPDGAQLTSQDGGRNPCSHV